MRRDTITALLLVVLALGALAGKSILLTVPAVHDGPRQFDASRAKSRLAFILGDERPHPADSLADDRLRARLVSSLQQIGLRPIVRDQMACNAFKKARLLACARVRNVIAAIGPQAGKALLLSAHYDSVPVGPGAADDGIGVATLLEVGSILRQRSLGRPVFLLFNEGEELGLIGARAFLADPLSQKVDSLLNFEARGVNGPVTMFETSDPNGPAITAYASAVERPFASSLSTDVARFIPNDTDVTTFKERGWLILNSAIVGNETRYHSPGDDLAGLDARSLQSMGDEALALTTKLSNGGDRTAGNRVFFDLAQRALIQLPLPLAAAWLILLLAAFCFLGARRADTLPATALVLAALILGCGSSVVGLTLVGLLRSGTYWRAHPELTFIALYATVLAGEMSLLSTLGLRFESDALRRSYWLLLLLFGGLLALVAPGAIIYFLIPPSFLLLGTALSRWHRRWRAIGAALGLIVLYITWGELLGSLEELFSPGPLWVVVPLAAIIIAPSMIETCAIARACNRRVVISGAAALALIAWTIAGTAPAYSSDHQQRFTIEHVTEMPSGRSYWSILNDGAPLPAAYSAFGSWRRAKLDYSERRRWLAAAPGIAIAAATVTPREIANDGNERTINLRIVANGAERILIFVPAKAHVGSGGVQGFQRPIEDSGSPAKLTISCTGRNCDGADLVVTMRSQDRIDFTIVGSRNGLPLSADPLVRGRPQFARPQYVPDETVTVTHAAV